MTPIKSEEVEPESLVKKEHERRFYPDPKVLPVGYDTSPWSLIVQGYLEDDLRTRLRDERDESGIHTFYQTRKLGEGVSRDEDEKEISGEDFLQRWPSRTCDLEKTRYYYPLGVV